MAIWRRREREEPERSAAPAPTPAERDRAPNQAAEFLAAPSAVRTSLAADSVVSGRLSFSSPTQIDGTLRGEVRTSELLIVGEGGVVEGKIHAPHLVVLGDVDGHVVCADHVEIGPLGRVQGILEAPRLTVREGGKLNAECRIGTPRPGIRVLPTRPAAAVPAEGPAGGRGKD